MESENNYDFNLFRPRNRHGIKNRNIVLSMLVVWFVAVFGFQFLLRAIEKPVPEKTLEDFGSVWPSMISGKAARADSVLCLRSLLLVRGKITVNPKDQKVLDRAIGAIAFNLIADGTLRATLKDRLADVKTMKASLSGLKDSEYLRKKEEIAGANTIISDIAERCTAFKSGSLESVILISTLSSDYPESLSVEELSGLPALMNLYLTHNQSVLTDKKIMGFPFHYFYTAFFLLVLFVFLCILYNVRVEMHLRKEGIVE